VLCASGEKYERTIPTRKIINVSSNKTFGTSSSKNLNASVITYRHSQYLINEPVSYGFKKMINQEPYWQQEQGV
jgi:hypothetical protein